MAIYKLNEAAQTDENSSAQKVPEIEDKTLISYVRWFISIRWIVISIFVMSGITGHLFSAELESIGISLPVPPMFLMSLILFAINCLFFLFSRNLEIEKRLLNTSLLWIQIVIDLIFVTALVYFVGSTITFIPFIYLIHIALSCIFFSRSKSVIVVSISSIFYLSCVLLQNRGILDDKTIIMSIVRDEDTKSLMNFLYALSAIFIWFVLWYFISTLSVGIRQRESSLRIMNEELKLADEEKTKKVIVTTHDLKAPFVGIESNINLLKYLHWDELPDTFRVVIDKIEVRSKSLRAKIDKILELGNLRILRENEIKMTQVNLKKIFDDVLGELAEHILDKKISLITEIFDINVISNEYKLKSLFSNIISNAVFYTKEQGEIEVKMTKQNDTIKIIIRDTGIGIDEKYLDRIFDEYFRTPEAAKFNKMSSGLGLQIVKTITEQLGLSLQVESVLEVGTTFIIEMKL